MVGKVNAAAAPSSPAATATMGMGPRMLMRGFGLRQYCILVLYTLP